MEQVPEPHIVKWPSDEETKTAFEAYTLALGKVAHAWNYLHENLAKLFCIMTEAERAISLAVWYSTTIERAQREMLRAAVSATNNKRWEQLPKAREDLKGLLEKSDVLAGHRNNAVHAPCSLYAQSRFTVTPATFDGRPASKSAMRATLRLSSPA